MGFLDKLKIKHKDDSMPLPPPAPTPADSSKESDKGDLGLPPLPDEQEANASPPNKEQPKSESPPMPEMPSPEAKPSRPMPAELPPLPETSDAANNVGTEQVPTIQQPQTTPSDEPTPAPPVMPPQSPIPEVPTAPRGEQKSGSTSEPELNVPEPPKKVHTTEDMRKKFSDMPPIKVDPSTHKQGILTDDHAKELDVDRFVLPGQEESVFKKTKPEPQPQKPVSVPAAAPAPKPFSGPLFVDVKKYEEVQDMIKGLKEDMTAIDAVMKDIHDLNEKEDAEFTKIVEQLEHFQDNVLKVDEELFEKK